MARAVVSWIESCFKFNWREINAMQNKPDMAGENARLRGDLLTIALRMSHDLRTPLGGIVTATEVLKEMLAEKDMPVTLTQTIFDSVDDMGRLIKQISFIIRATAGPIPRQLVPMNQVVAAALQRLESRTLKKQAVITEPASWPQINGVAPWLEEVWWNLLANALQHTTDRPRIELGWREENGRYRFQICDNGGGVPDDMRAKLFRPFHDLHKLDGARGLGLSIVQRLIDLQGGDCGYEPKPGGSCFFFSLPAG
jgi:signal transduction histidine kinase